MKLVQKNILYNDNAVVDADASYAKHGILSTHRVRKEKTFDSTSPSQLFTHFI